MASGIKYKNEFKERAVRLYFERRVEHQEESKAASIRSVAQVVGMPADSLRTWARVVEVDAGKRPGVTSDMAAELRRLRRENTELKRANAILCQLQLRTDRWWQFVLTSGGNGLTAGGKYF